MMHFPKESIPSYFSSSWGESHSALLVDERWTNFSTQLNAFLELYPLPHSRLPYFNEETTAPIQPLMERLLTSVDGSPSSWAKAIESLHIEQLLIISGQRFTPASLKDLTALPPLKDTLLQSCFQPYNDQISTATRAWEKHVGRFKNNFWGSVKGSSSEKEKHTKALLSDMITSKSWWNTFYHYKHHWVFEIRVPSGHGVRWSKDGKTLIGFLEPFLNE